MNKIKLIEVITRLDRGGSSELALLVCRKIDKTKFEPVLIYGHNPLADYNTSDLTCVHIPELKREISPAKDCLAFICLYKFFLKEKPDIIQTNSSKAGFIGRWAALLYNMTLFFSFRGSQTAAVIHMPHGHVFYGYGFSKAKVLLFLMLERISALITDKIVAITEGEKHESLDLFGIGKSNQWTIINPGAECAKIDPSKIRDEVRGLLGIPTSSLVVGAVARFEPVKGIIYLIEAIGLIEKRAGKDIRYLIVGDGTQRPAIERRAAELGITGKIVFTGMSNNVFRLMSAMDVFVQPSLNEGMGKTLVQAHSLGLPIIATKVQGIPDVVVDGVSGYLVPPADPEQLAEKTLELLNDTNLRRRFGKAGKDWVTRKFDGMECFSEERVIHLFEKLYESFSR